MIELDGLSARKMLLSGLECVRGEEESLNRMNVFPVPDGDTGTNIRRTLEASLSEPFGSGKIGDFFDRFAEKMLLGARGNSGTIISAFYKGLAAALSGKAVVRPAEFAEALRSGYEGAYDSIQNPVEGTVLSVIREASEYVNSHITEILDFETLYQTYFDELYSSYEKTDEILQVLKSAGVKDSGACGYIQIVKGELEELRRMSNSGTDTGESLSAEKSSGGKNSEALDASNRAGRSATMDYSHDFSVAYSDEEAPAERKSLHPEASLSSLDFSKFTEDSPFSHGYCMEFVLRLMNSKTDVGRFDKKIYDLEISEFGNSIVSLSSGSLLKVHIHTFTPAPIIEASQKYGEFLSFKLENMALQHSEGMTADKGQGRNPEGFRILVCSADEGASRLLGTFPEVEVFSYDSDRPDAAADGCAALCRGYQGERIAIFPGSEKLLEALKRTELGENVKILPSRDVLHTYLALAMSDAGDAESKISEFESLLGDIATFSFDAERDTGFDRGGESLKPVFETLEGASKEKADASMCFVFAPKGFRLDRVVLESRFPSLEFSISDILLTDNKLIVGIL